MLSGRYPSDEFAELRPRITWDRIGGEVRAREGARHVAVVNGGTIPDRGLYGVFLAARSTSSQEPPRRRARRGDGLRVAAGRGLPARRVVVADRRDHARPRPGLARAGRAGQDAVLARRPAGRPPEFGRAIGELARELASAKPDARRSKRLREDHGLDARAAANLSRYLAEQARRRARCRATGRSSSSATSTRSATGASACCRRSARACTRPGRRRSSRRSEESHDAATSRRSGPTTASSSAFPSRTSRPTWPLFLPAADEVEDLVVRSLGQTSLFAARFRENAARALLLLPRRHPAAAARCGRSASARRTFSRSPRATDRSRSCSRPTASACATSSTCRG